MPRARATKRSDGRYQIKFQGKWFYGKTAGEAQKKCAEYKRLLEAGMRVDASAMTVREYAANWLPTHKASVGDKTYADYAKQLNVLVESIGDLSLMDVKPDDIKRVYNHYIGYSASTIKRARMIFSSMFNAAIENGYVRVNPCKSEVAQPHKGTAGTHRAITDEERQLIINTPHRFRAAAMVMLYAGLRRGEAMAINIDEDVNTAAKTIIVSKAVRFQNNQPVVVSTKTDAGIREIPLFSIAEDALHGLHGLLMPAADGSMCSDMAFVRGWDSYMHALSQAAGKKIQIRPHDLRHSYCTMLRDAGVDMKLAMQWMGHADEKMILRIYDHITERRIQSAIENVERFTGVKTGVKITEESRKAL